MSRKVILFIAQTLDGYIAEENGNIDFLIDNDFTSGDEKDREYTKLTKRIDTVVIGRRTYDQVVNELSPNNYPYSDFENYILTTHPGKSIDNIHFINEDVVKLVEKLKQQPSKRDILIVGGSRVIAPLVSHNLIDIYQIGIVPIILGKGIPLFASNIAMTTLTLESAKKINSIVYLEYRK